MTALARRLGLRARVALTLVGMATLAVGLATVLVDRGVESELRDYEAGQRTMVAANASALAAAAYERDGRWSPATARELDRVARTFGYTLTIQDQSGRPLAGAAPQGGERASAPVRVDRQRVGSVTLTPLAGNSTEQTLRDELRACLREFNLVAALLAIAVALLVAVPVSAPLVRPVRQLIQEARRMEAGDLASRVQPCGGSEIERLGLAFNRLAHTLQQENRLRCEAAADLSHELRTPVTGIVSRIETAQDGVLADGPNLEAMHSEALRLSRLIEDVGRLAESEQPAMLVKKARLDLAGVAAGRAEGVEDLFQVKDIELVRELEPVAVDGDAGRLEQIVDNLLSNALRYTPPGGRVTLAVRRRGDDALLEVSDTGVGIAAHEHERAFDRYWRADPSRSRGTGGSGIGLAVVKQLVLAHEGSVEVESAPVEGSTFRVTLAARGRPPRAGAAREPVMGGAGFEPA